MGRLSILGALLLLSATSAMAQGEPVAHPTEIQAGVGFTFDSFNEVPGTTANNFGFNASLVSYRDWLGAEAEGSDAFGSQSGQMTQLMFVGGGIRVRWPNFRSVQPWVHGVVGYSRFSPNAVVGNHSSFGDKAGGGIDFIPGNGRGRIRFRIAVDMFNTNFFNTHQVSPEGSAGIVISLGRY